MKRVNKNTGKILGFCLSIILALIICSTSAEAKASSGKCGDNLKWAVSENTLKITGEGEMDWGSGDAPWNEYSSEIKKIYIGKSVTSIAKEAFINFDYLKEVTLSEKSKLTKIEYAAFKGCENLKSMYIPEKVTVIETEAFYQTGLEKVTFSTSAKLEKIGNYVFKYCDKLKTVTIPKSVEKIGDGTFHGCINLSKVKFAKSSKLEAIEGSTFRDCTFTEIDIPKNVTVIEGNAFYNNDKLTTISLPEGITSIGHQAFAGCLALKNVELPEKLITIADRAFYKCESLTGMEIGNNVVSIGEAAFRYCISLKKVDFGQALVEIGRHAFEDCNLESISLLNNVSVIGKQGFYDNKELKKVRIGSGIAQIDEEAFGKCESLEEVLFFGNEVLAAESAFNGSDNVVIYGYEESGAVNLADTCKVIYRQLESKSLNKKMFQLKSTSLTWNGKTRVPGVICLSEELIKGFDYSVSSGKNSKVGTYQVTIKGVNEYKGSSVKLKYSIRPKKVTGMKLSSPSKGKIKVNWTKSSSSNCSRYEIQYWKKGSSKKKLVKVSGYKNTTKSISNLSKGSRYYVRIRQYKNGEYSDWSSSKYITVKKK